MRKAEFFPTACDPKSLTVWTTERFSSETWLRLTIHGLLGSLLE